MNLTEKTVNAIKELQKKYPERRSALIPALHIAQSERGYLPPEIQADVADLFDIAPSEVEAVVAFYDMFYEEPVAKHIIHVCKNVSCMLNGADCLMKKVREKAGSDYTVIPSECLAACDRAPMMLIDDKVFGPVIEEDLDKILGRDHG